MKANDLLSQFGDHRQRVQSAITSVCEGRGILLVDDENRENEGDLIFSAQSMTEADMAIMIRHCSGIVCLCITEEKARQLNLPMQHIRLVDYQYFTNKMVEKSVLHFFFFAE